MKTDAPPPASYHHAGSGVDVQVTILPALLDNYIYILAWQDQAAVIDPGEAGPVRAWLRANEHRLAAILNTHHHQDHVGGNLALKQAAGCPVIGPDDPRIPGLDRPLGGDMSFTLGPLAMRVISTPGHGRSDVSFYLALDERGEGLLWSGDALFCGGCGRLFEGEPADLFASLRKLAALPDATRLYCGHEYTLDNLEFAASVDPANEALGERYSAVRALRRENKPTVPSTLGVEKRTNPFLRTADPALRRELGLETAAEVEVFAALRARKDVF